MKQLTVGLFDSQKSAEEAINEVHQHLGVDTDEISYLYRNERGQVVDATPDEVAHMTPGEGAAEGAAWGAGIGGLAGLAIGLGVIPVVGPVLAAGPLVSALGLGAGVLGTTAAGAATGAATGALVGVLVGWGVSETEAKHYEERVREGDILVTVHADDGVNVRPTLEKCGAREVGVYPG